MLCNTHSYCPLTPRAHCVKTVASDCVTSTEYFSVYGKTRYSRLLLLFKNTTTHISNHGLTYNECPSLFGKEIEMTGWGSYTHGQRMRPSSNSLPLADCGIGCHFILSSFLAHCITSSIPSKRRIVESFSSWQHPPARDHLDLETHVPLPCILTNLLLRCTFPIPTNRSNHRRH